MAIFDFTSSRDKEKFTTKVVLPILREALLNNPFAKFIGSSDRNAIIVKSSLEKGAGGNKTFSLKPMYGVNEVYDDNTLQGKGTNTIPVNDRVYIGETRFATGATSFKMAEFQVSYDFKQEIKTELTDQYANLTVRRYVNQFAWNFAHGEKGNRDHVSYDYIRDKDTGANAFRNYFINRIKTCPINQLNGLGNGISQERVLFGKENPRTVADIAAGTTIDNQCTVATIGTNDYAATSGVATLDHIKRLRYMMRVGGRKLGLEKPITPLSYRDWNGYQGEKYTFLCSPSVGAKFMADPNVTQLMIRPLIESKTQPSFYNGTDYLGTIDNVDVIVINEFEHFNFISAANINIGFGVMVGAQAIVQVVCEDPMITYEDWDHGKGTEIGMTLFDGLKCLKFPSKYKSNDPTYPPIELGLISSFTVID